MDTFPTCTLTCYRRDNGERMVALEMQRERDAEWIQGELNYIRFYFTGEEFEAICTRGGAANDIGHNLRVCGEQWTFFDLDFPAKTHGTMTVPYVIVTVPYRVSWALLRIANAAWRKATPGGERIRVDIPLATRQRWLARYGHGKGAVELDVPEGSKEFFEACLADEGFRSKVDHVKRIAQNSTYTMWERARVRISKDWDGFYWVAVNPRGNTVMNGGIINHSREGAPDWSIHT